MPDKKTRALLEAAEKHQEVVVCGNPRHTNFDIGCPDCAVVCDYCTCPWPCDARKLADALSALTALGGDAREKLKAESLKNWQAGVEIRRYSEFFTSFEDGFDRGYAAALSRAAAPEWEYGTAHADDPQSVDMGHTLEGAQRRVAQWNAADPERKGIVVRAPKRAWEPLPVGGDDAAL